MADLMQELRTYAEQLERDADPVTWGEVASRTAPAVQPARRHGWLVAAAAATAVLVLVGVVTSGTLFGGGDVADGDAIIEPNSAPMTINTPYGDVLWYEITGSEDRVPGTNVTALADGTWAAGDQNGRSWTSSGGIRWTLAEESGSTLSSEELLENGVWTRQIYPDQGPNGLSVSFDDGISFVPVTPPTEHPDDNLAWTDYVMTAAPLGENPEDGIMVIWMANGSVPWAEITGIQDTILNVREVRDGSEVDLLDGIVEIATGPGEDATNLTRLRMAVEGTDVVVYDMDGTEQWRHRLPEGYIYTPSEGLPARPEEGVDTLAHLTYALNLSAQVITPAGATAIAMPADVDTVFSSETDSIAESFSLFAGDELRLVGFAPASDPADEDVEFAIWRWTGSGWEPAEEPAWLDDDVTWVTSLRSGSDDVVQVAKTIDPINGVYEPEFWLDWDEERLNVPVEVAEGFVFRLENGYIGTDSEFDRPRFWYSPDGTEWTEITAPFPAYGESNNGGTRRVWAEGDRVFAIDEPFGGDRTFRVADVSDLSPTGD